MSENPETIEISGLATIHKLCNFAADRNMEGCSFTDIVERMFDELKAQQAAVPSVPEGFVLVPRKINNEILLSGLAVVSTGVALKSAQTEIEMLWVKMIEAAEGTTPASANDGFYLASFKRAKGFVNWWKPKDAGYTPYLNQAGIYTSEDIKTKPEYYDNEYTIPVPVKFVKEFTVSLVDSGLSKCEQIFWTAENLREAIKKTQEKVDAKPCN